MNAPTPEQVQQMQGTRRSEIAPWETYAQSFEDKVSPQLQAEIDAYAQKRHDKTSEQNKEELARWKEGNDEIANEYRWCTKQEYEDVEARVGKIIHSSELINILRTKCRLRCWYRTHPHSDKLTLMISNRDGTIKPNVAGWVQNGFMPEYTVMGFDDHGVPLAEKYRGWRTVVLQLVLNGYMTEDTVNKVFGRAERRCAGRYNSILWGLRNEYKE